MSSCAGEDACAAIPRAVSAGRGKEKNERGDEMRLEESWGWRVGRQRCAAHFFLDSPSPESKIDVALGRGRQGEHKRVQKSGGMGQEPVGTAYLIGS